MQGERYRSDLMLSIVKIKYVNGFSKMVIFMLVSLLIHEHG